MTYDPIEHKHSAQALDVIAEPVGRTHVLRPAPLVTCLAAVVRNRPVEVDHLPTEIALSAVAHLSGFDIKILHFDVELVERTGSQSNEYLLSVFWVPFFGRVREYPVLTLLAIASRTQRYRLGELVGHVMPVVVSEPGVMARRTWVLWVDISFVGHTRMI